MSFASQVKSEICANRPFRQRHKTALAYGLLLFGRAFGPESISLHTEHKVVARLYADSITDLVGISDSITVREIRRKDRPSVFAVTVDSLADRIAVLSHFGCKAGEDAARIRAEAFTEAGQGAFLSGVFLACGALSDPEKDYRLEFSTSSHALCRDLESFLAEQFAPPKETVRRNNYLLYYKESGQIEDILILIGAQKSAMSLMDIKILKDVRNQVNRATNCETANIMKTVDAAMAQVEAIRRIEENGGLISLPEDLREIAQLRLDNPELSLRELGGLLSQPISRSGVNHRLQRICEFAKKA